MSELKAYIVYTPREGVVEGLWKSYAIRIDGVEIYLKSEADKVIERISKQLRHQKYKRCLAMASYWLAVSYQCVDDKHRQRAKKHRYKWLELAEQFKEAK